MAQITIYLPDDVAREARKRARKARKSLSTYVCEILARETTASRWPQTFVDLLERGGGDLIEPRDVPPEEIEPLR